MPVASQYLRAIIPSLESSSRTSNTPGSMGLNSVLNEPHIVEIRVTLDNGDEKSYNTFT